MQSYFSESSFAIARKRPRKKKKILYEHNIIDLLIAAEYRIFSSKHILNFVVNSYGRLIVTSCLFSVSYFGKQTSSICRSLFCHLVISNYFCSYLFIIVSLVRNSWNKTNVITQKHHYVENALSVHTFSRIYVYLKTAVLSLMIEMDIKSSAFRN